MASVVSWATFTRCKCPHQRRRFCYSSAFLVRDNHELMHRRLQTLNNGLVNLIFWIMQPSFSTQRTSPRSPRSLAHYVFSQIAILVCHYTADYEFGMRGLTFSVVHVNTRTQRKNHSSCFPTWPEHFWTIARPSMGLHGLTQCQQTKKSPGIFYSEVDLSFQPQCKAHFSRCSPVAPNSSKAKAITLLALNVSGQPRLDLDKIVLKSKKTFLKRTYLNVPVHVRTFSKNSFTSTSRCPSFQALSCPTAHIITSTLYVFWKQTLNPHRESDCVDVSGL